MEIRDATTDDLPAIVAMYADDPLGAQRELADLPLDDRYRRAFGAIAGDSRHRLVVAVDSGEIVGTLQLSFLPTLSHVGAERAQIESVRVSSARRGGGLGRPLLDWAVDEARRRGCGQVQLMTDATRSDARRFYESLGFRASHLGMKLQLDDAGPTLG